MDHTLLKLDPEKAFAKLEWSFIYTTLQYSNMPPNLITLIMSCVTTSSISILINGTPTQFFSPTRGIRQGDPLSPYVFILYLKRLSRSILQSVDYLHWHPIKLSKEGPPLSHSWRMTSFSSLLYTIRVAQQT